MVCLRGGKKSRLLSGAHRRMKPDYEANVLLDSLDEKSSARGENTSHAPNREAERERHTPRGKDMIICKR